ncbi:MAG: hypothetical protein WKH97_04945 [Casimicrobiaceae bacterium]
MWTLKPTSTIEFQQVTPPSSTHFHTPLSSIALLSTVFKLAKSAEQRWLKLRGAEMIAKVITGVQYKNGVEVQQNVRQEIAA